MAGAEINLTLRLSLREGTVYYFTERSLHSVEPHYFIVVNADPVKNRLLLMAVVTSKIDKVKQRRKTCLDTVVEISPAVFDVLTMPSIVDCNRLWEIPLKEFNQRFENKEIKYFDQDLPVHLRKALRKAIHASMVVTDEQKARVAKP